MKVKIKKLHPNAVIPSYAYETDAGLDMTAISMEWDYSNKQITYGTGLGIQIPEGHVGLIFPRSSIYKKDLTLSNSVGVIDSGFLGEIKFKFNYHGIMLNYTTTDRYYNLGERIGQLVILPFPKIEFEEVDELSSTKRGTGGFGSTNE